MRNVENITIKMIKIVDVNNVDNDNFSAEKF